MLFDWGGIWARDTQRLPNGEFFVWLILAGRGFGKTRVGAETVRHWAQASPYVNMAAPTAFDVRQVMVDGPSGVMAVCPKSERPTWVKSDHLLRWPNGCRSLLFSADEPDRFRGPQCEKFWADELAAWRYPEAWDQAMFGLRLGSNPQAIVTTTPRPIPIVKELLAAKTTFVTRGSTYDNRVNLARQFFDKIITKYEGTRLGRQELNAEVLDDNPSALFSRANIDANRVQVLPSLSRVVVAIDPAATSGEESDDTGIMVVGRDRQRPPHFYVMDDLTCHEKPAGWANIAVTAYRQHRADRVIGETNNGGEMIEATLRSIDQNVPYRAVHASRGKVIRAEPISALYEQNRVHHVGFFGPLEDECCDFDPATYEPGKSTSPNRMDALVWAITELSEQLDSVTEYYAGKNNEATAAGVAPKETMVLPKDVRVWSEPVRLLNMGFKIDTATKEHWPTLRAEVSEWIDFCAATGNRDGQKHAEEELIRLDKKLK